jgi:hypothetical protein
LLLIGHAYVWAFTAPVRRRENAMSKGFVLLPRCWTVERIFA